jgi:hypothetical protein
MKRFIVCALSAAAMLTVVASVRAQCPFGPRRPEYVYPEVSAEKKDTFRIHAPKAQAVKLFSSDIPRVGRGVDMKKADNGVWQVAVGPVALPRTDGRV